MIKCKDCIFYRKHKSDSWGACLNKKTSRGGYTEEIENAENPLLEGGGFDGYGDYLRMKPDFGCILAEAKTENDKQIDWETQKTYETGDKVTLNGVEGELIAHERQT
jgi:hypothetical protein